MFLPRGAPNHATHKYKFMNQGLKSSHTFALLNSQANNYSTANMLPSMKTDQLQ